MKRIIVVCFCGVAGALTGLTGFAAEQIFPSAGGDLSSNGADGWNGNKPSSSSGIELNKAGTYTLSADEGFSYINLTGGGDYVFDFGVRKLSLGGKSTATGSDDSILAFPYKQSPASCTLKGGVWYSSAAKNFNVVGLGNTSWWPGVGNAYSFAMTNGCVITNVCNFGIGNRISNLRAVLSDGSRVYCNQLRMSGGGGGTNAVLELSSGSQVTASGGGGVSATLYTDMETSGKYGLIDIHDAGSALNLTGNNNNYLGYKGGNHGIRVRDAATFVTTKSSLVFSQTETSSNNWCEVLNGATATVYGVVFKHDAADRLTVSNAVFASTGDVYTMNGSKRSGHRIEVLDGAEFSAKSVVFQSHGNSVFVSNATLNVRENFKLGNVGDLFATGNVATFSGSGSVFGYDDDVFNSVSNVFGNTFRMENGFSWRPRSSFSFMNSPSNVFQITRGAVFDNATAEGGGRTTYLGSSTPLASKGNLLEISAGATFKADRFFVYGYNNRVVVSNATLSAGSKEINPSSGAESGYSVWLGYQTASNVTLVLQGRTPAVRNLRDRTMICQNSSVIRWEIPPEGYEDGFVPVTATGYNISEVCRFEVECSDWAAVPDVGRRELVLLRSGQNISASSGLGKVVAALGASGTLPEGVSVFVRNADVVLRSKSKLGFTVLVR